jgi:hypothetical protein
MNPHDAADWSKKYEVLSVSRLFLSSLGFTNEQIMSLSEEDLHIIADWLAELYVSPTHEYEQEARFITAIVLAEKENPHARMIDWERQFPIACINRADLTEFGLNDQHIAEIFTDEVMAKVADQMQAAYFTSPAFWGDFRRAALSFVKLTDTDNRTSGKEEYGV